MAANLGLDTLINTITNLPANATGFASNLITLLGRLKSDSSDNLFGTAALKNVGTAVGNVPELGPGGRLSDERIGRGVANGVAPLDANATVPLANLPELSSPDASLATKGLTYLSAVALFADEKVAGQVGGTFTSGQWRTRDLTTSDSNDIAATLSANRITLVPGVYRVLAFAPAHAAVGKHRTRLRDITNATTLAAGVNIDSSALAVLAGTFTLTAQTVIELQHQCEHTKSSNGFGAPNNDGEPERFACVSLTKVAP